EAWGRGDRPLKLFVSFDFSGAAEAGLRWVEGLLAAGAFEAGSGCGHLMGAVSAAWATAALP
ncbi:MAG: hypothetical protein WBL40_14785, partial [Terrimicrobiaceae bacterium]